MNKIPNTNNQFIKPLSKASLESNPYEIVKNYYLVQKYFKTRDRFLRKRSVSHVSVYHATLKLLMRKFKV